MENVGVKGRESEGGGGGKGETSGGCNMSGSGMVTATDKF